MLRELKRAGWRPASESDRTGFGELADLAQACSDDTLGDLLPDEPVQLSGHRKSVIAVAMAADLVASADNEGVVRLWRLPDGTAMAAPRIQRTHLQCMALSPDGALLATGGLPEHPEEAVQLWELPSGNQIHSRGARCHSLAVTPDGRLLVVGGDGTIDLWRLPDCTPVRNVSIHADHAVARLTMTADGGLLATCCQFGRIQFWRLPDLTPAGPMRGPASQFDLALTGDGGFLATANAGDAKLWRMPDLTPIGSASPTSARCLTATSDGRLLAAGLSNGAVAVSRMPYATQLSTLTGHAKGVRCLAVSPDGGFLASGGGDRMVLLWDLRLWRAVHTPIGALEPPAADFSGSAQVWALLVGALVRWRRRYDIEVDTVGPAATDIEVGRQGEGA